MGTTKVIHGTAKLRRLSEGAVRRFRGRAGEWLHAATDLIYPAKCAYCDDELTVVLDEVHLCDSCRDQFIVPAQKRCRRCAAPLSADPSAAPNCHGCEGRKLNFDEAITLGTYEGPLRTAILRMKSPLSLVRLPPAPLLT